MEKCSQSILQLSSELVSHVETGHYVYEPFAPGSMFFSLEELGGIFGSPR